MAGLLTESIMEKLQRSLLSSDPRMSNIRLGMIEKLGPLTGKRQIAPTMGEVMGAGAAGIRQGEKDFLTSEMQKFQLEQIKAPNQQVVGDGKGGYKLVTIGKPELQDDGTYSTPEIDIQEISKGITPTTLMVGVDDIEIKNRIPDIDLTKETEGTIFTFEGEKYKIDRKKKDKKDLYWEKIDRYNELNAKVNKTAEDISTLRILKGNLKNKESINDILVPIAKKILKVGFDKLTKREKETWLELRRVPWLESLMKGNSILEDAISSTTSSDDVIVIK